MNYNIIYDCKHKKYYDINSNEGTTLINNLYTIIETHTQKKNEKKNNNIDTTYFNEKKYKLTMTPLGHMKCKLFYAKCSMKKTCCKEDYENILVYILQYFIKDHVYMSINLYEYIYILYKIKKNISKHYKLITLETPQSDGEEEENEEEDEEEEKHINPLQNIINIDMLVAKYNQKYTDTKHIIRFILNPNHTFILYNVHHLLDINIYKKVVKECVKKNFINNNII
jgi:hypothetical protein